MITSYNRPATLEEALVLLVQPGTVPLGGGTLINTPQFDKTQGISVVDLQGLGMDRITVSGQSLELEACVTLQQLLESEEVPATLKPALKQEAATNLRNMATVAGTLVAADGRSPFATVLLALEARLTVVSLASSTTSALGDILALRHQVLKGRLITKIAIPLNAGLAYESVARTPGDKPIISVALARWPSGRLRLALGGFGEMPLLGMDASDIAGLGPAARNALHDATDEWASAEYREDVAATLVQRCLKAMGGMH